MSDIAAFLRTRHRHVAPEVRAGAEAALALHTPAPLTLDERDTAAAEGRDVDDRWCPIGVWETWPCRTVRLLAAPFAQHPSFDPAWTVKGWAA